MYFNLSRTLLLSSQCFLIIGCATVDASRDIDAAHTIIHDRIPYDSSQELWSANTPLTMNTAVATAIMQDALLQRDLAVIVQRRAELVQSGQLPNPTISGAFGIAVDGLSGAPLVMKGMQGLSWLWTRPDRVAAAEHTLQQSILTAAQRATTVATDVKTRFAQVNFSRRLVDIAKEEVAIVESELEISQQLLDIGEAAQTDIDRAQIHAASSILNLSHRRELYENSLIGLLTSMGIPTEATAIELSDGPIQFLEIQHQFDLGSLLALAVEQRLDLSTKYAAVQQRSAALGFANPPLITATVGFNENFNNREAVLPGVSITIPLDGEAKEAAATSMLEQAKATYTDALRNVQAEVRTSLQSFESALEQLLILREKHVAPSQLLVTRTTQLHEQGEVEPLELLELRHKLVSARQAELKQLLRTYEAYYQLQYAVGGTFKELSVTTLMEGMNNE